WVLHLLDIPETHLVFCSAVPRRPVMLTFDSQPPRPFDHATHHHHSLTADVVSERRFVCDEPGCGKRFNRKFTLKEHMKTHTGARPYACDYDGCSACFSTSGNLSRHKFTHTGEKPFGCTYDMCPKRFCTKEKLARHIKTHSGVRPFTCKVNGCNKRFSTSGNLGRHIKTHRDAPPSSTSTTSEDSVSWKVEPENVSNFSNSSTSSTSPPPFEDLSPAAIDEHIISVLRYDTKSSKLPPPVVSLQRSHSDFVQNRTMQQQQHHHPLHHSLQIAIPPYNQPPSSRRLQFNMIDSPPAQWHTHLENTFPTKHPQSIPEYEPLPFDHSSTSQPKLGRSLSEGAFFNMWL
ncbi:hypothetical protein LEN26_012041, partial [Aphanomyces euteiches]